jgi:hypothetical protein
MGKDVRHIEELRDAVLALKQEHPAPNELAVVYHPCDRAKVDANEALTEMLEDLDLCLFEWPGAVPGELDVTPVAALPPAARRQPRWREAPLT